MIHKKVKGYEAFLHISGHNKYNEHLQDAAHPNSLTLIRFYPFCMHPRIVLEETISNILRSFAIVYSGHFPEVKALTRPLGPRTQPLQT